MTEKYLFVDVDTPIVAQAATCQLNYKVYKKSGEFICSSSSQKKFFENYTNYSKDDVYFEEDPVLKTSIIDALDKYNNKPPMKMLKKFKGEIEAKFPDREIWYCVQGDTNYRDEVYPDYKGQRISILLKSATRERFIETTKNVIVSEGEETDDVLAKYCYKGYCIEQKTGVNPYMIAHIDKDLDTVAGDHYNFNTKEIYKITPEEAFSNFCIQLLMGDATDHIKGVNGSMPREWFSEHGLRYTRGGGIGKTTAKNIIEVYDTPSEMLKAVVDVYRAVHGDVWVDALQEEALALRMRHFEGEMYDIRKTLRNFNIAF